MSWFYRHWRRMVSVAGFLLVLGFQVSDYHSVPLAWIIWSSAAACFALAWGRPVLQWVHGASDPMVYLSRLREQATHTLLNRPITDAAGFSKWLAAVNQWEHTVIASLERVATPVDVSWFRVLTTYSPKGLPGWSREHAKQRDILAERLDRLLTIMNRLKDQS